MGSPGKQKSIFIVCKGDLESVSQDNTGGNADEKGVDAKEDQQGLIANGMEERAWKDGKIEMLLTVTEVIGEEM